MTRDFLKGLGLEDEAIDKILNENMADIGKEKAKTTQAKEDLTKANEQLEARTKDLEELKKSTGDVEQLQKQLDELQTKYDGEKAEWEKQAHERDYANAITADIAAAGLKFSSRGAEKAFREELKARALTLKDGALVGFGDFVKEIQKDDPSTFAPEKLATYIVGKTGVGLQNGHHEPENVRHAKELAERRAAAQKESNDVLKNYL